VLDGESQQLGKYLVTIRDSQIEIWVNYICYLAQILPMMSHKSSQNEPQFVTK